MDEQLLYLRKEYGDVFVTELPSGQTIPWRPLSVGEYLKYESMFHMGHYNPAYIEDEIFRKCVLDSVLVKSIDQLKAGVVSTVAVNIYNYSAPQSVEEVNYLLEANRRKISQLLPSIVAVICQAFPSYKPEEVESMNYQDLMYRAAQAESKLMFMGALTEPITLVSDAVQDQTKIEDDRQKRLEENRKMMDKWYQQEGIKVPDSIKQTQMTSFLTQETGIPKYGGDQTIITKSDMVEHEQILSGHEKDIVHKVKATDDTAQFYTDYLDQLKENGKLEIMTPEERKAAAEARMEANKQKLVEQRKEALQKVKDEIPELLKVREEARKRKAKKAAKRRR